MATTKNNTISDLVVMEVDPKFTREDYTIRNTSAATRTVTNPVGTPLNLNAGKMEFALAAGINAIEGLLLESNDLPATANNADVAGGKRAVLVRGPAIVAKSILPTVDVAGSAITMSDFITRLAALDIQVRDEPAKTQGPQDS